MSETSQPDEEHDPIRQEFRRAIEEERARNAPRVIERRTFYDAVFRTMQAVRNCLGKKMPELLHKKIGVEIKVRHENGSETEIIEDVSALTGVTLGTTVELAVRWDKLKSDSDAAMKEIMVRQAGEVKDASELHELAADPPLHASFQALAVDQTLNRGNAEHIERGINGNLVDSKSDFTVDVRQDLYDQCAVLARGILDRMTELLSAERSQVLRDMEQWREWAPYMEAMRQDQSGAIEQVYNDVLIDAKDLRGLVSPNVSRKEAALQQIEQNGGFLHGFDLSSIEDMIHHGVTAVVRDPENPEDILGYYGVITDEDVVRRYLQEWCGFDPACEDAYDATNLPKQSSRGPLQWQNPKFAAQIFREPEQVGFSVEVAVRKSVLGDKLKESRRNSGVATALKHRVYSVVDKPFIVTRHFEIKEVNGLIVPSAINFHSRRLSESLGGRPIGSLDETDFAHPSKDPAGNPPMIGTTWHFYVEERNRALERIEQRRGLK